MLAMIQPERQLHDPQEMAFIAKPLLQDTQTSTASVNFTQTAARSPKKAGRCNLFLRPLDRASTGASAT